MGSRRAWFVLDTGTSRTTVNVALIDELGYGAHVGIMGASLAGFEVVCEDVDPETLVDGLIGLIGPSWC